MIGTKSHARSVNPRGRAPSYFPNSKYKLLSVEKGVDWGKRHYFYYNATLMKDTDACANCKNQSELNNNGLDVYRRICVMMR
jgi:hypothetical protein